MVFPQKWIVVAVAASLSACGGGGSSGGSAGSGQFNLALTDAPVESADQVVVTFSEVTLKRANDEDLVFAVSGSEQGCSATLLESEIAASEPIEPCSLDLLELTNGNSVVLVDAEIPAGDYTQIRLGVEESGSYLVIDGAEHGLTIPSGEQTGLKLVREFSISESAPTAFTIDFDVRKSLVQQGNGAYKLKPTLRIVETAAAARIVGTVDEPTLIAPLCGQPGDVNGPNGAVHVYSGSAVTPDDIGGSGAQPVSTATVAYNAEISDFEFTAAFLPAGDYSVAYTCDADDPEADDDLTFSAPQPVSVAAGATATVALVAE